MNRNKRVVFFRDCYFPMDTPGGVRVGNLVKYFVEFGHSVDLFAIRNENVGEQERDALGFLAGVRIHLIRMLKLATLIDGALRVIYRKIHFVDKNQGEFFSTTYLAWQVKRIVKNADVLVVSYPYCGSLPVIRKLAQSLGVPYVIDFRDLPDEFDPEHVKSETMKLFLALQPYILDARFVVTVTQPLKEALKDRYGCQKVFLSLNGYEGDLDIPDCPCQGDTDEFVLLYTGMLGFGRHLAMQMLLTGLRLLKQRGCPLQGVKVVVVGKRLPEEFEIFVKPFVQDGLFEYRGCISRKEALVMQRKASILLSVSSPEVPGIMTSKIFEYVKTGHLIVNLPSRSDIVAEFLLKSGCGLSMACEGDVCSLLGPIILEWQSRRKFPRIVPDREYLLRFSRREQARIFAEVINAEIV